MVSNSNKIKIVLEILIALIPIQNEWFWSDFVVKLTVGLNRVFILTSVF